MSTYNEIWVTFQKCLDIAIAKSKSVRSDKMFICDQIRHINPFTYEFGFCHFESGYFHTVIVSDLGEIVKFSEFYKPEEAMDLYLEIKEYRENPPVRVE